MSVMAAPGRKRPLNTAVFQQFERPLSGKADIGRMGRAWSVPKDLAHIWHTKQAENWLSVA